MKKKYLLSFLIILIFSIFIGCSGEKSAKDYYKDGMESFEKGEYKKAEEALSQCVKKNTEKAEYYIDYGFALIKTKKYDQARVQFDKAILSKDNKIVRENNKKAHRGKGIAYYTSGDFNNAVKEFEAALDILDLEELNTDLLYYKGSAYEKTGDFKKAGEAYEKILKTDKPDAQIYGALAGVKYQLGEQKEALSLYDKAIALESNEYEYYIGKYAILSGMEDENSAKEVLEKAKAIKTKTDSDYYNLSKIQFFSGDDTNAKKGFVTASEKGFYEAYFYLGEIAYKEEDFESAVEFYEKYMNSKIQINLTTVYERVSSALMKIGEYEKAEKYIQSGIALNDAMTLPALKFAEVAVYEKLGEFEKAYEKAAEYIKTYPNNKDMKKEVNFLKTREAKLSKEQEAK